MISVRLVASSIFRFETVSVNNSNCSAAASISSPNALASTTVVTSATFSSDCSTRRAYGSSAPGDNKNSTHRRLIRSVHSAVVCSNVSTTDSSTNRNSRNPIAWPR